MRKILVGALMLISLIIPAAGEETKGTELANAIVAKNGERFPENWAERVDALPPILDDIGNGKATQAHWRALELLDSWSDGIWWAEFEGACFDAVTTNPEQFMRDYLNGEDRALWIIRSAMKWTTDIFGMGGFSVSEQSDFHEFNKANQKLMKVTEEITKDRADKTREDFLFVEVRKQYNLWQEISRNYQEWLANQEQNN